MRSDLSDISFVLDRSGSMSSVRKDTIGGFNAFIEEQQKQPGECLATLVQFDHEYEIVYSGKPIKDIPKLSDETYIPRGMTALLDAIGRTINEAGNRLALMAEEARPANVIVVILTDGDENSSREFNAEQIHKMINLQRDTYNWTFIFLGANQDAIKTGASLGVAAASSMTYANNQLGTKQAFRSVSAHVSHTRSGQANVGFTAEDRQNQKDAGAK